MGIPVIQQYRVGKYLMGQKLKGVKRFPVVLMLEPLFRCNLACAGCGKIDYPKEILNQRLSTEQCLQAVDECGAPIVSIPGGEPLIHKEIKDIVEGIIERKKFIYLCTNALLLSKHIDKFTPSKYLTFSVHLDGLKERHDASVCQEGVFEQAVDAIKLALSKGFRVNINCTLFQGETAEEVAEFMDYVTDLGVEGVTISPGYSYEHAPQQEVFMHRQGSKQLFRDLFKIKKKKKARWAFNQSSLFMNFLSGNETYQCTPWGNPTRNVFGWQKPCYLLADEGYAETFQELMETTHWDDWGNGRNPKCADCMVHCGYEPTAINDTVAHPFKALKVALFGPRTDGPMAPELPVHYEDPAPEQGIDIPVVTEAPLKKQA
jgi:hopanoid biosynthesis associated radical SAM protein HpnH